MGSSQFEGNRVNMSHFKTSKLAWLLAGTALTAAAGAASAQTMPAAEPVVQTAQADDQLDEIVVVGAGQTRSVSTLTAENLAALPPGTSIQKALNYLPGVMAQSIDALGVNEQSLSLQVRGYSTTSLGYSLDGMPLGDGAYNNYNGLTISRALISENLGRADLATGIAGLSIPSTSNLGGALVYTSRNPARDMGFTASQSFGSEDTMRTFMRFETGEHAGFSAYVSGQYSEQDLFVNQAQYKTSWGRQLNAKAVYDFGRGRITAFADLSRTNQADDAYLSKDMLNRLGPDWGGYAGNWDAYVGVAACSVASLASRCVAAPAPQRNSDVTFTNGQILRNDDLYYLAVDYDLTDDLSVRGQIYSHTDEGAGNNFITGLSTQGTATTADDVPVQIRDTRYTIDRQGVLGSAKWTLGMHEVEAGFWLEENTSSAARYIHNNVTGPFSLAHFISVQPATAQWVQETEWETRQFYVQDTVSLTDDITVELGFKSTWSKSDAYARPGIAAAPPPASSQFATGSLTAEDNFLPQIGVHWQVAPDHELYASYSENIAMFQGGFKLGPQSVSQTLWDLQGSHLKPQTSQSFDAGYRYVTGPLQVSVAAYHMLFNDRLLQYNPCPTNQQQNPGCGNTFHNAGGVTSDGFEVGALWRAADWLTWYNSVSINETTYDDDLNFCTTTCVIKATAGKQQVDTPKEMVSSVLTATWGGFSASLAGKYTGERFYTYTNDQGFDAVTTFDLGLSYDFENNGAPGSRFSVNITNLTDERYASNFDSSVFAPDDAAGSIVVFHTSAPRQIFATLTVAY